MIFLYSLLENVAQAFVPVLNDPCSTILLVCILVEFAFPLQE